MAGLVVEKINVFWHERFLDHSLREILSQLNNLTFTGNWMYLHWFLYGDKWEYTDFRNIINFKVHVLFLTAGLRKDKAREKGLLNVYIFQQPIALSKTSRFQNNLDR